MWDVKKQNCIATLEGDSIILSPDGTLLDSNVLKDIKLWNIAKQKCIATLEGHSKHVQTVGYSPYGVLLASGCSYTVKLWYSGLDLVRGENWIIKAIKRRKEMERNI
ncbi:repeat-containing protein [Candidatus Magnetomorum sp. HK-1]|nr:repeat-containing protein [Candidatus Magnetomorum sp. HK-1]